MKTVLFAWELGGGLGHLGRMLPLAHALAARGHRVVFALRELARAALLLCEQPYLILQAPIWQGQLRSFPQPASYAEILLRQGYFSPANLTGTVRAWHGLMDLVQPDLMIADFAPTAMLAARSRNFPVACYGSGFFIPPHATPLPPFRTWEPIALKRLADSERNVLASINHVLVQGGSSPLSCLADLFAVAETFLCTVPELDHYRERPNARYWKPVFGEIIGIEPTWPSGEGKRIYAYLKPEHPGTQNLLALLKSASYRSLVYLSHATPGQLRQWSSPNLHIVTRPLDLTKTLAQADVAICHAGIDTIFKSLVSGVPVLCLPMQAEQFLTSTNVERLNVGINIAKDFESEKLKLALDRLLVDVTISEGVRHFAERYSSADMPAGLDALVQRCNVLIGM
jgi:UDP:flavonoid glycosyltransferase YjiC (YdhE family)